MDVQVKAGSLVRTIVDREISGMVGKIVSQLQSEINFNCVQFSLFGHFGGKTLSTEASAVLVWWSLLDR